MLTEAQARRGAAALLHRLKGRGWKTHIWENLGWHYAAYNGGLSVYADHYRPPVRYHTLLNTHGGGGDPEWTMRGLQGFSTDPNVVVRRQLRFAQASVAKRIAALQKLDDLIGRLTRRRS